MQNKKKKEKRRPCKCRARIWQQDVPGMEVVNGHRVARAVDFATSKQHLANAIDSIRFDSIRNFRRCQIEYSNGDAVAQKVLENVKQ